MALRHPGSVRSGRLRGAETRWNADSVAVIYAASTPRGADSPAWPRSSRAAAPRAVSGSTDSVESSPRLERLLDDAASLNGDEIERLAAGARQARRGSGYTEALLAIRRAAETSGRTAAVARAGTQAEHLVLSAARAKSPTHLEDRARWSVVVEQASWVAGDAARALVVSDLLGKAQLYALTAAWEIARIAGRG